MKQLHLLGVSPFAPEAVSAPKFLVRQLTSEAEAVRWCLDYAREFRGMNLTSVARATGWKNGKSFLSELTKESSGKRLPPRRLSRFTLATGYRLLEQYRELQEGTRAALGRSTQHDREQMALEVIRTQFGLPEAA